MCVWCVLTFGDFICHSTTIKRVIGSNTHDGCIAVEMGNLMTQGLDSSGWINTWKTQMFVNLDHWFLSNVCRQNFSHSYLQNKYPNGLWIDFLGWAKLFSRDLMATVRKEKMHTPICILMHTCKNTGVRWWGRGNIMHAEDCWDLLWLCHTLLAAIMQKNSNPFCLQRIPYNPVVLISL